MFSAKSDGQVYIAGRIDDPKSRDYTCPTCGEGVSHVSETTRSLNVLVSEHFRHKVGEAQHPHKRVTWQVGNIMRFLLENFSEKYGLDENFSVETDRRFQGKLRGEVLDFVVDLVVKERMADNKQTAVIVESDPFNANEFQKQLEYLTQNGIATMLVLSAYGTNNSRGNYFRSEFREENGSIVKNLGSNERAVCAIQGHNIYFGHDAQMLGVVTFNEYTEFYPFPVELPNGHVIPAGDRKFLSKKIPVFESTYGLFGIVHEKKKMTVKEKKNGVKQERQVSVLVARPVNLIDYYFDLEQRAEMVGDEDTISTIGERIAISLDSMDLKARCELTERYGMKRLGGYAVKRVNPQ